MNIIKTILILHGSEKKNWLKNFLKLKKNILKKNFFLNKIYISNLKSKNKFITKIINKNYKKNFKKFFILPIFLLKGKHFKKDILILLKNILKIYNNIKIFFSKEINNYKNLKNYIKKFYIKKIKKIKKFLK